MNSSNYKDITTTRGLNYHYYFSPATEGKSTVVLVHGFPSTSFDWHNQVTYLQERGYGLIVPDMIGYGGTAKPVDPTQYTFKLIVKDIVDIIDAEGVKRCVAIGHDWGSIVVARLATFYPDRFIAFGFLAVGYSPPSIQTYQQFMDKLKQMFHRDIGYQVLFGQVEGTTLCDKNVCFDSLTFDSFYSLVHPINAETLWPEYLCPPGATKKWVEENKQAVLDPHIPPEDHAYRKDILQKWGLAAPMCWYRVQFLNLELEDNKQIPESSYVIDKPVFLGLAEKDTVTTPALAKIPTEKWCKNLTTRSFDGGHWLMWENKDKLSTEIATWLETL
ncbi:Bifunctional epoxide hydrolase 2 [Leucoagaricus sp. SymC.cos]|nr:Bifunctional epoxide hydrolase 2 [Leucoagaricus sp. SymC.cos]